MNWLKFWIEILLPVLSILIPVYTTIYTVNRRVENENKETHKPYLVLKKIDELKTFNVYEYYLTLIGRNFLEKYKTLTYEEMLEQEKENQLQISLLFRNIGYGVATNIKFYDLLTAQEIYGTQASNKEQNQKLFTTFDIASSEEKDVPAKVLSVIVEEENKIKGDHNRILCVYKDLNNHTYSFIFSINIKNHGHYDFFAYQPSSRSYKKWIKQNKKQYHLIMDSYNRL